MIARIDATSADVVDSMSPVPPRYGRRVLALLLAGTAVLAAGQLSPAI